jgi:hypothetical protein
MGAHASIEDSAHFLHSSLTKSAINCRHSGEFASRDARAPSSFRFGDAVTGHPRLALRDSSEEAFAAEFRGGRRCRFDLCV